jgi:hypothetical protein
LGGGTKSKRASVGLDSTLFRVFGMSRAGKIRKIDDLRKNHDIIIEGSETKK